MSPRSRILVTGASGWVGQAVTTVLAGGYDVRSLDLREPSEPTTAEVVVGDLGSWDVARAAVESVDAIVHVASSVVHRGAMEDWNASSIMHGSVVATVNLFEAAVQQGVRRIVLMSSAAVVTGYPIGTMITAASPPCFRKLYPLSKWLQEVVAHQYASEHQMVTPILRPWVVVDAKSATYRDGRPLPLNFDPYDHNGIFGWIDRFDLARACRLALEAHLIGAEVFHLVASRPGRRVFDVERATRLLDWRPQHTFDEYDTSDPKS
jgi:nucleoside-diphosphate-sugar epimerase